MGEIKIQKHVPRNKMHSQRTQFCFSEQTKNVDGNQHSWIRINAMIEEFAQRTTGSGSPSLFTIDSIYENKPLVT